MGFNVCPVCNGKGTMTCPECGGTGFDPEKVIEPGLTLAEAPHIKGSVQHCHKCAGTGEVICERCGGTGEVHN